MFPKALSPVIFLLYFVQLSVSIRQTLPVCPRKLDQERTNRYPYVWYGTRDAPRCYVASRQGPCSEGSVLFAKPRSPFGICSCECFLREGVVFDDSSIQNYRYCFNSTMGHTYVYDKKRCACYRLGSQGPCPPGQVLQKNIYDYEFIPRCVKEDSSNQPTTPIDEQRESCPPGTIYSTLLNVCTDMTFRGLSRNNQSENPTDRPSGKCPPGTIYSTLLNICTDMNFKGLSGNGGSNGNSPGGTSGKCPPGTIYSTLLNICTDMNFHGLPKQNDSESDNGNDSSVTPGKCPPGTIYSTLLNICTDMNFHGLPTTPSSTDTTEETEQTGTAGTSATCPPGTIYSTLLNECTDMNFHGLSSTEGSAGWQRPQRRNCPRGTIFSELLNKCIGMNFRGLINNSL